MTGPAPLAENRSVPEEERTPVPSAAVPVTCPQCGQTGLAGRRFCGRCGTALWQRCPECETQIAASDRFCPACGVEVDAVWNQRAQTARQQIAAARNLAAEQRFDEALAELARLSHLADPPLAAVAQEAAAELAAVEAQRAEARHKVAQAVDRARQLEALGRWKQARDCLAKIPPPLRDSSVLALDHDLALRMQQEASLRQQIAAAVAGRQWEALSQALDQLLSLRPHDAQGEKLAGQLRQQMLLLARKQLAAHRYRSAVRALNCIPGSRRDEEVTRLWDEVSERAALHQAIADAPYADAALAGLVRRMAQLVPDHPDVPRWRKTLAQRLAESPTDPHWPAPAWAAPSPSDTARPKIESWAFFSRAHLASDELRQTLREHPGQFFTALGVALEALGLTAWTCDLSLPREGLLARLPNLSWQAPRAVWALDLGSSAVKALRVVREDRQVRIDAAYHLLVANRDDVGQLGRFEEPLKALVAHVAAAPALVCLAVPGRALLGRFFELPVGKGRAWDQALRYEAQHQLPLPLAELCWHAHAWPEAPQKDAESPPMRRVVLQAAQRSYIDQLLAVCRTAGLEVARLQSQPLALHHAVQWELAGQAKAAAEAAEPAPPVLVVDLGLSQTVVVASASDHLAFRTLLTGTETWSRQLINAFSVTHATAQQWLRDPAACPAFHRWHSALQTAFEELASQLDRCRTLLAPPGASPIRQALGLGGGFQTHGLLHALRTFGG